MCLWLCGACRSENSLEADPEIRILMKVICWRDILGRRGEAGWGRGGKRPGPAVAGDGLQHVPRSSGAGRAAPHVYAQQSWSAGSPPLPILIFRAHVCRLLSEALALEKEATQACHWHGNGCTGPFGIWTTLRAEIPLFLGFQASLPCPCDPKYDNRDIWQEARLGQNWDCVIQEGSASPSPMERPDSKLWQNGPGSSVQPVCVFP